MRDNRILFGVLGAGLVWSIAASAVNQPTTFYAPVDLTDQTPRQVYWQTETTPCEGNDANGPDNIKGTADDVLPANTAFILDAGCAVIASDAGAQFEADPALEVTLGLPAGSISNGLLADFTSDGTTATVTVPAAIWGPVLKNNVDTPGLVTVFPGTTSDYVFTIDIASGDVTSFVWTANADTVLGPASLNIAPLPGTDANWYTAEATAAPGASGATTWACGTGGYIAQPTDNPATDPGSLGTCPPDLFNASPTTTNTPYAPADGTLFTNASSYVLGLTPRAWGPLDGRLSELDAPEPGALLLGVSALVALGALGRRRDG
jgi:hypothetical protein